MFLHLIRLFRIIRLGVYYKMQHHLISKFWMNKKIRVCTRILKIFLVIILTAHWGGCVWHYIGAYFVFHSVLLAYIFILRLRSTMTGGLSMILIFNFKMILERSTLHVCIGQSPLLLLLGMAISSLIQELKDLSVSSS